MKEYGKIDTVFDRDPGNHFKTLLDGSWTRPEFGYLQNNDWQFTEKVDGTNIRVMWCGDDGHVELGGKTENSQIPAILVNRLREVFMEEKMAERFGEEDVCLYGEGFGAKIQGGGNYKSDGVDFVLFDMKIGKWWLKRGDISSIASFFEVPSAPLVGIGTLHEMVYVARDGFKSAWGDFIAEGIVARPVVELTDRGGQRIITKIKYKDFAR